jgi:Uma2 family endonuclease
MSSVAHSPERIAYLSEVDWETYEKLRAADGNRNVRMTYDAGDLEIMSPSKLHERIAELLAHLILVWAEELNIALQGCGSLTFKRKDLQKGFEPDKCYYIQNEGLVRDREQLDLLIDPPPDLAIEVDVWSSSTVRMPLYAAMRVPEVWRWRDEKIHVFRLSRKGRYVARTTSDCLPDFPFAEVERLLGQRNERDQISMARSFRRWVRKHHGT